jgi:hypothetical protein
MTDAEFIAMTIAALERLALAAGLGELAYHLSMARIAAGATHEFPDMDDSETEHDRLMHDRD